MNVRKNASFAAALIGGICVLPVQAEDSTYYAISVGKISSDVANSEQFDTANLFAKLGKQIGPNLAIEGVLGLGIMSDDWSDNCDSQEVSTDTFLGAQLVGSIDLSPEVKIHGTLGMMQTSATVTISGSASCYGVAWSNEYSDDDTDLSYGIGIDYQLSEGSAITADYQFLYDDEYSGVDLTISGLLIGYKANF